MRTPSRTPFAASLVILALVVMMAAPASSMAAEPTVPLGTTSRFAILAGTTITNIGATVISGDAGGDIGVSPGSAITGFPPGILSGARHSNDAIAIQAMTDWVTAYNNAVGRPVTAITGVDLGGLTLGPGVYTSNGALSITGTLTLDAGGDPEAVFIFKSDSTLTANSGSVVNLINGAKFCRVFWPVVSSATLETGSKFAGHIFAVTSITAKTGATVQGQLLAQNGAVTLDSNTIVNGPCADSLFIHVTKTPSPTALTGPGSVTYTYRVSNPGLLPLTGLTVTDDKLGLATYVSGDTVLNPGQLDPSETWVYTAATTLAATTTNIVTVRASQTGTTTVVVDYASATVAVAGRLLPNTATPWYTLLLAGVVLTLLGAAGYWMTTRKIHG